MKIVIGECGLESLSELEHSVSCMTIQFSGE